MVKPIFTKNTQIRQVWWWAPVIPATWEPEVGESLEPGGGGSEEVVLTQDYTTALQPGQQSQTPSQKKRTRIFLGPWVGKWFTPVNPSTLGGPRGWIT